jgi:hypothetical protein
MGLPIESPEMAGDSKKVREELTKEMRQDGSVKQVSVKSSLSKENSFFTYLYGL